MSYGAGRRHSSYLKLLWLRRRLAGVAPIGPLAGELPYVTGVALKKAKKKNKQSKTKQNLSTSQKPPFHILFPFSSSEVTFTEGEVLCDVYTGLPAMTQGSPRNLPERRHHCTGGKKIPGLESDQTLMWLWMTSVSLTFLTYRIGIIISGLLFFEWWC